jgi:hypothetical protein
VPDNVPATGAWTELHTETINTLANSAVSAKLHGLIVALLVMAVILSTKPPFG